MVQANVLAPLLKLLRSPNIRVQEQSAATVQNLSVNNDNKLKILEEGGIRALVSLLSVQDVAVAEHAAGALRNLRCVCA